jgi:hypothetical protein
MTQVKSNKVKVAVESGRDPLGVSTVAPMGKGTYCVSVHRCAIWNWILAPLAIAGTKDQKRARLSGRMLCLTGCADVSDLKSRRCMPLYRQWSSH